MLHACLRARIVTDDVKLWGELWSSLLEGKISTITPRAAPGSSIPFSFGPSHEDVRDPDHRALLQRICRVANHHLWAEARANKNCLRFLTDMVAVPGLKDLCEKYWRVSEDTASDLMRKSMRGHNRMLDKGDSQANFLSVTDNSVSGGYWIDSASLGFNIFVRDKVPAREWDKRWPDRFCIYWELIMELVEEMPERAG